MKLEDLGYNERIEKLRTDHNLTEFSVGRVIAEHKERYIVRLEEFEVEAEITGLLRYSASSRQDFPAVGDWVAMVTYDTVYAIIHKVIPRLSVISRRAAGHSSEKQIIATNIDYAFIVQAVDRDFNINRMERYLTICNASKVEPIIILTKTDLIDEQSKAAIIQSIHQRLQGLPVFAISNETQDGYDELKTIIEKGKTYCMLGSSGVGKSTLLNNLSGKHLMLTDDISESTHKGRHVTTHRELIVLENGGILIDNPGMREVGVTDTGGGLETTFDTIFSLARNCRYKDCTHTGESGCAVAEALEAGRLDVSFYENYQKLQREKLHFETSLTEKRKKERIFGKILKDYQKRNIKGK